jgi:hypothetical protein
MASAPEPSQQLKQEWAKSFLHRLGIGLVTRRLVRNRIREQGMLECLIKVGAGVFLPLATSLVSPENSLAHQSTRRSDERLNMTNFVPAHVAPKKTHWRFERAGEQDRLKSILMNLLINIAIDRQNFTDGFLPDNFDQIIDGANNAHAAPPHQNLSVILAQSVAI